MFFFNQSIAIIWYWQCLQVWIKLEGKYSVFTFYVGRDSCAPIFINHDFVMSLLQQHIDDHICIVYTYYIYILFFCIYTVLPTWDLITCVEVVTHTLQTHLNNILYGSNFYDLNTRVNVRYCLLLRGSYIIIMTLFLVLYYTHTEIRDVNRIRRYDESIRRMMNFSNRLSGIIYIYFSIS